MENLIHQLKSFSNQIEFSLEYYSHHRILRSEIDNLVMGGLGGSGIAGHIVKNYFSDKIDIPVEVVSDYILPRYISSRTLVILSSYSGNSEETLALYHQAKEKKAKVLILTSGGELERLGRLDGYIVYKAGESLEGRMALGYSLTYLLLIFFEILGQYKDVDLKRIASSVNISENFILQSKELAKTFSSTLNNKFIVVTDPPFEGIGTRFVQQLQENAKVEAFISVIPEANHNTLSTYTGANTNNFLFLNSRSNHQTNLRFSFLKELLISQNPILEMNTKDYTLSTLIITLYELDWLAMEIASLRGEDAGNSRNVINLKNYLKKANT
jgi:glucose/mannose-6-phosphate isomerase